MNSDMTKPLPAPAPSAERGGGSAGVRVDGQGPRATAGRWSGWRRPRGPSGVGSAQADRRPDGASLDQPGPHPRTLDPARTDPNATTRQPGRQARTTPPQGPPRRKSEP